MESLQFNFCHPVKGLAKLFNKAYPLQNRILPLNAESGETINIPTDGLCSGKWKVALEWEHEDRNYFYEQEFEIV